MPLRQPLSRPQTKSCQLLNGSHALSRLDTVDENHTACRSLRARMESCQARPAVRPVIPDLRYISCQRTVCWKFRRRNTHHRVADRSRHNAVCRAEKDAGSRSSESTEDSLSPEQQEEEGKQLAAVFVTNLLKFDFAHTCFIGLCRGRA